MELAITHNGETSIGARAVWAPTRAATLLGDLERSHTVQQNRHRPRSPLELVLGAVVGTGGPARRLAIADGAGIDWTPGSRLADGAEISGATIVERVDAALDEARTDVRALVEVAEAFLIHDSDTVTLDAAREALNGLLAEVELCTWVDLATRFPLPNYTSASLVGLAAAEVIERGRQGEALRPCEYCGAPFFPAERSDERYCRREAPGQPFAGRPCRGVGPQARYQEQMGDLERAYRRNYKRLDQRARRGAFPRADLDAWRERAQELLADSERRGWSVQRFERLLEGIEPEG